MKRVKTLIILTALVLCSQGVTNAIQTGNLQTQQEINKNTVKQAGVEKTAEVAEKLNMLTDRYYNNLRTCEPLHFHHYMDIFGFKFGFKIDINGWNADKCEYRMAFNMDSFGKDIKDVFDIKITDEQLTKLKPVVECNFTKEQLNIMVDAVIARNQKSAEQFREMLKNPNEKYVNSKKSTSITPEEEKLLAVLMGGNVCSVPNKDELMNQFTDIVETMYSQESETRPNIQPSEDAVQKPQKPEY